MRTFVRWGFLGLFAAMWSVSAGCGSSADNGKLPTASMNDDSGTPAVTNVATATKPKYDRLHPQLQFHTNVGDFTVKLDAEHAPLTVDNFLTYVEEGHYDSTLIHQVFSKSPAVVLGGGYDTFGKEKPCHQSVRNEAHNGLKNRRGTIGMARRADSIDSSTAQFYINLADNPTLDHKANDATGYGYCVFGEVVSGMDVCEQIGKAPVHDTPQFPATPVEQVVIKWVHLVR
jgi:peptidyl-prolyl cis-trans isomerase B (cyclophilin B)